MRWGLGVRGIACGAQGGGLPAQLEEVALPVHLKDVDAVSEAVQECTGEPLRAEDLGPLVEGEIGGDQDRSSLVALAEDFRTVAWPRSWTAARSQARR